MKSKFLYLVSSQHRKSAGCLCPEKVFESEKAADIYAELRSVEAYTYDYEVEEIELILDED